MSKKILSISIIANVVAFGINLIINFLLTPYIVNNVGSEAYGFVSLSNNFTNYALILTIALNSMAGRFISISYHRNQYDEASTFFKAVVYGNIFMSAVLLIPALVCIFKIDVLLNISNELIGDIRLLFIFIFIGFFISLFNSAFATATFVANRKDLEAKRNIESNILKASTVILLFCICKPKVFYVGVSVVFANLFVLVANIYYTKKLTPEIEFRKAKFDKNKFIELIKSGIWNSVTRLSSVLSDGLDLLITNLFIGSAEMGVLAIAKLVPSTVSALMGTLAGVFVPNYTIAYAHKNKEEILEKINQSILILSIFSNVCLIGVTVIGKDFFDLWVPTQSSDILQRLSLITIASFSVNGGIQCIYNIFTVTNKLKVVSLVSILNSAINLVIVFILLNTTNLGIYAVAGVSAVTLILRTFVFTIPYAAHCIKVKSKIFYLPIMKNLLILVLGSIIGIFIKNRFVLNNWVKLLFFAFAYSIIMFAFNIIFITTKSEKKILYIQVKKIVKRWGNKNEITK